MVFTAMAPLSLLFEMVSKLPLIFSRDLCSGGCDGGQGVGGKFCVQGIPITDRFNLNGKWIPEKWVCSNGQNGGEAIPLDLL